MFFVLKFVSPPARYGEGISLSIYTHTYIYIYIYTYPYIYSLAFLGTYFYWDLLQRGPTFNDGVVHWKTAFSECKQISLHYGSPYFMFGRRRKAGDVMIGCASHGDGQLTFCENTCDVEGREEQHDPMIMKWQFTSEATKSLIPLPAQTSKPSASGAQEHATKEADPKPLPNDKSSASEDDAESEPI